MDKVLERSKEYEQISIEHDPIYNSILDAIEIVKEFIRRNKLIIYGGSGMDYALRLKGDKIYPDNAIPDLDFFSPDSIKHAYTLADILYDKGYTSARTIRALFVHTMRVDLVDNHFIADISYIPPKVFAELPYLEYDGMRIIHPEFQKIDLHSSLSFPYDNSPKEVIFDRWNKDVKRYNLLDKYYPTEISQNGLLELSEIKVPIELKSYVLSGFLAYAVIYTWFIENIRKNEIPKEILACKLNIDKEMISIETIDSTIDIVHFDAQKAANELQLRQQQHFHPYINLIPELLVGNKEEVFIRIHGSAGKLLSVNSVKLSGITFRIANIHYLMKYFLAYAHLSSNKKKNRYLAHYISLQKMIALAEDFFAPDIDKKIEEIKASPLFPSVRTYGNENYSASYAISINYLDNELSGASKYILPVNYYPERARAKGITEHPSFDYSKSIFFLEAGEPIEVTGSADHHMRFPQPLRTLDDIKQIETEYNISTLTASLHIGQQKLFLVELKFLTKYADEFDEKMLVIYAGSAPSIHTPHLHKFFPNVKFILVDPAKFDTPLQRWIFKSHTDPKALSAELDSFMQSDNKFLVLNDYMTVPLGEAIRDSVQRTKTIPKVYFWSDVRSETDDGSVVANSAMQLNWVKATQAAASMLKFREPFYRETEDIAIFDEKIKPFQADMELAKPYIDFAANYAARKFVYFDGEVWIQPFAPMFSTETRLVFDGFPGFKSYKDYKPKLWYYNNQARQRIYYNPAANRGFGFDHCNDCALEFDIFNAYRHKMRKVNIFNCVKELSRAIHRRLNPRPKDGEPQHGNLFP